MMKKRIAGLALGALMLAGCGFTPANAPRLANGDLAMRSVRVDVQKTNALIPDEAGFYINQRLRDRLGTQGTTHVLEVVPKTQRFGLGVSGIEVASRYDLRMIANYTLRDAKTGDVLDSGSVLSTSTFGAPKDPYGLDAAENNATRTAASETADRLLLKLAAYYSNNPVQ